MQLFALNQSNNAEKARNARGGLYLEQQYITCFPLLCRGRAHFLLVCQAWPRWNRKWQICWAVSEAKSAFSVVIRSCWGHRRK